MAMNLPLRPAPLMGERRADALFTLPVMPRTAQVVGPPGNWPLGLEERGVEVVSSGGDLVVSTSKELVPQSNSVIAAPGAHRRLRSASYVVVRLLPVRSRSDPTFLLNLDHRRANRNLLSGLAHNRSPRSLIDRVSTELGGLALLPMPGAGIVTGSRRGGPPALIAAAGEIGARVDGEWSMNVTSKRLRGRCVFVLHDRRGAPRHVVKFARQPGISAPFDREQAAWSALEKTARVVTDHAPRLLGRFEVGDHLASAETAAAGQQLSKTLIGAREPKTQPLEMVVDWLIQVARETRLDSGALKARKAELLAKADLSRHSGIRVALEMLGDVPAVFEHGEMSDEHIFVHEEGFTVIDWEHARADGFPLWDLFFFAANALAVTDGAAHRRYGYIPDLFAGRAPSSPVLFGWVRRLVAAMRLPSQAVGALAALHWLTSWAPGVGESWMLDPALRHTWDAWKTS